MLVKIIQMNDKRLVACLGTDEDDGLQFYCQDEENQNYAEHLAKPEFVKRLKDLNKRVQFPVDAVRQTLSYKEPFETSLSKKEGEGSGGKLITLKYRMEGTSAPFKWEWHIKPIDKAKFYRFIALNSITKASQLSSQMSMLMNLLQKKDIELKQYRIEGFQLRRTTVATEPFDIENYKLEHDMLLTEAASYGQLTEVFDSNVGERQNHFSPLPKDVKQNTSTPGSSASTSSSSGTPKQIQTISPRNRKRMALEKSTNHLEKKVLQRQREPQLQYKDSQSQEDNVDDWFEENPKHAKMEKAAEATVKEEQPQTVETSIKQEEQENSNELNDLLAILDRTSKANEQMLKEANKKK